MQQTGIVRRIDDLGRIVIPREMRKTLRIKEGDPLEILASEEGISIKKYSPLKRFSDVAESLCLSVIDVAKKSCAITDTDTVIYCDNGLKETLNQPLSKELLVALKERKSLVLNREDGSKIIPIIEKGEIDVEGQIIVPIISNGDCFGAVIILEKEKSLGAEEVKLCRILANVLSRQCD